MTDQPVAATEDQGTEKTWTPAPPEPRTVVMLVAGFSAVLVAVAAALLPVHYAVLHPGPVLNTLGKDPQGKQLISITGRRSYPTTGQLDLTTVSVAGGPDRRISLLEAIQGWLRTDTAVVPEEEIFAPGTTQQQNDAENKAEMVSSQESATAAALSTLGIAVPTTLTVAGVEPSAPAAGVLESKDVIRSVNGQDVGDLGELRTVLQGTPAGGEVRVGVRRKDESRTLTVGTAAAADGHTVLGVFIDPKFEFPFTVKIQIEDIGGPSAGMMFALGIIDTLTPGDLTGGKKVAGTGTIDADGQVGPIGGIRQKLIGARRAGARYFLAPVDNCADVREHVPDGLRVVRVETLTQARDAVAAIAANQEKKLPSC